MYEINALIEKLFVLLESKDSLQIDSTITKIDSLTKQVSGSYSNYTYDAMKYYIASIKGNYNKDLVDTFMDVLGDGKCTKKEWTEIGEKLGVFTEG